MADERLRAVLIGAGSLGANTLRALCSSQAVELAGVSDQDSAVASTAAAQAGCPAFNDHRRLLAQVRPQAIFMAVPPQATSELIALAVEYKASVWKGAPLARNLPEGVAVCRQMEQSALTFAVGLRHRFMSGYRTAKAWLGRLGNLYLVQGHYLFNAGPVLSWRADSAAGGGALREVGTYIMDLVIWMAGVPETVYCVAGTGQRAAGQAGQPLYETEDSASVLFRYDRRASAAITLSRCFDPVNEGLWMYGQNGSVHAGPNRCVLRDREGAVVESFVDEGAPVELFSRQIESFARAAGGEKRYESSALENLLALAVLDTAYLSDRTGQPESPAGLLAKYDVNPADCLKYAPS